MIDRTGRHIGGIVAAEMHTVYIYEAFNANILQVRSSPLGSTCTGRDGEGSSVMKHPLFGGDHAWGRESDPVRRRGAHATHHCTVLVMPSPVVVSDLH